MGRILAIDYGKRRTGLAVTDPLGMIAGGLCTVETKALWDFVADYVKKERVDCIVVGWPRQTSGEDSENMCRVRPFVARLRKNYPDTQVELFDERFTSVLAHRVMLDSGIGRKARQDKGLVDKISATIILEDFLESRRS